MSELTQLKGAVVTQAEERCKAQLERAKVQQKKDFEKKQNQLIHDKEEQRDRTIKRLRNEQQREIQQIKNKERQSSLASKQEIIMRLFDEAVVEMNQMNADKQYQFIDGVLKKYNKEGLMVTLGQFTKEILSDDQYNLLRENFSNYHFSDETIHAKGGFILSDDRIDYNYLYEELVRETQKDFSKEIAQEIFTEE